MADKDQIGRPARPENLLVGATETVRLICGSIYMLDVTIEMWAIELNRAQPHRNGRLAIKFIKNKLVSVDGKNQWDPVPVLGKMILMDSGTWRFFKLTAKDRYEKLSDLRVGKSLKSDALVVRLIDGIEAMLKEREALVVMLNTLRKGTPGKISAIRAMCVSRSDEIADLSERVKIDWSEGPAAAEAAIRDARRQRYLSKLAKEGRAPVRGPRKIKRPAVP